MVLFSLALVVACGADSSVKQEKLYGKWNVSEAKRNGKLTRTFSNAYFDFSPDQMTTNFTGEVVTTPYTMGEMLIEQQGESPVRYTIVDWADSSFIMSFEYLDFNFEFLMIRQSASAVQ